MWITCWSNTAMAVQYQHITASIRRDVAQRVGGLLSEPAETADGSNDEDGAAGADSGLTATTETKTGTKRQSPGCHDRQPGL